MTLVLGVDGGNTKTLAVVADEGGRVRGSGRGGCADIYGATSADAAVAEIDRAVAAALDAARASRGDIGAACFSLAGADWPEDFEYLKPRLARHAPRVRVVNDAIGALWAGSREGPAVSVVCGTGAAVGARGPDGALWHTSWWQIDQGARDLGRKALQAVYRAALGLGPETVLTSRLLEIAGVGDVEAALHEYTRREDRRPQPYEPMARALVEAAAQEDGVALAILAWHAESLAEYAVVAAKRVRIEGRFTLVLAGAVLQASAVLRGTLTTVVRSHVPDVEPVLAERQPAEGAALLALELL